MTATMEAFYSAFHPGPLGQRLCIWHADAVQPPPAALVVHVHAFAEEMNKSRRMAALQARALAAAGCAVLQCDLLGCGDSAGDFADASWDAWLDDVAAAVSLARRLHAERWPDTATPALWLWGQRAGALLAAGAAARLATPVNLLLWQPTPSGKTVLQQFLRLETAGALFGKDSGKGIGKDSAKGTARATLAQGKHAEVAGYVLAPALTAGLGAARLQAPALPARLEWMDLAPASGAPPTPAAASTLAAWADAGWQTRHHAVVGPSFWQTTEIEEAPALIAATVQALLSPATGNATAATATPAAQPQPQPQAVAA